MNEQALHALLCHYYRERDSSRAVTIEDLEQTYRRIPRETLVAVGAELERRCWILHEPPAGHRITQIGIRAYLDDAGIDD